MHKSKDSILVIMYICKHRPLVARLFLDEYFEEEFEEDRQGCFVGIHAVVSLTIRITKST